MTASWRPGLMLSPWSASFSNYQLAVTIILMILVLALMVERLGGMVHDRIIEGD